MKTLSNPNRPAPKAMDSQPFSFGNNSISPSQLGLRRDMGKSLVNIFSEKKQALGGLIAEQDFVLGSN